LFLSPVSQQLTFLEIRQLLLPMHSDRCPYMLRKKAF
jgi:hypothetical protein